VLAGSKIKEHNNRAYWYMGVALSRCGYNEQAHHWWWTRTCESCTRSSNGSFGGLMKVKVVHTFLDRSVPLAGKSRNGNGGNSHSKQEHKAMFYLTA